MTGMEIFTALSENKSIKKDSWKDGEFIRSYNPEIEAEKIIIEAAGFNMNNMRIKPPCIIVKTTGEKKELFDIVKGFGNFSDIWEVVDQ